MISDINTVPQKPEIKNPTTEQVLNFLSKETDKMNTIIHYSIEQFYHNGGEPEYFMAESLREFTTIYLNGLKEIVRELQLDKNI